MFFFFLCNVYNKLFKSSNMNEKVEDRLKLDQGQLRYLYESAKARMEAHPEITIKRLKIAKECPRFDSEEDAKEFAIKIAKEKPFEGVKIWATIEKDEEYYHLSTPWMVSTGIQNVAVEYVGLCFIEDVYNPI